ncbi:MAG: hypothetical protein FJX74_01785 [Armatimonadetes bacterium]|nr:hypothetical protein [Armatimonadota bacterium]
MQQIVSRRHRRGTSGFIGRLTGGGRAAARRFGASTEAGFRRFALSPFLLPARRGLPSPRSWRTRKAVACALGPELLASTPEGLFAPEFELQGFAAVPEDARVLAALRRGLGRLRQAGHGLWLGTQGQTDEALAAFRRAIEIDPGLAPGAEHQPPP